MKGAVINQEANHECDDMAVAVDLDKRVFNGRAAGRPDFSQKKRKCEQRNVCAETMPPALRR